MATANMPTTLPALTTTYAGGDASATVDHADSLHNRVNAEVNAIAALLGVSGSAVATSHDYLLKSGLSIDPGHHHTTSTIDSLAYGKITYSGLTAKQVLRASGASAASFQQLDNTDLAYAAAVSGDLYYAGSTAPTAGLTRLAIGAVKTVLRSTGSAPAWQQLNNTDVAYTFASGSIGYAGSLNPTSGLTELAIGAANTILNSSGTAPQWSTPATIIGKGVAAFYPEAYGAVGDGSTDDTTALNNCISAAGTTGTVFLSKTYKVTGITISALRVITSLPGSRGVIYRSGNGPVITIDTSGGDIYYLSISDIVVRNDNAGTSATCITISGANYLRRSRICDNDFQGAYYGLNITAPMDWTAITGNVFENTGAVVQFYGIYRSAGGTGCIIANNRFIVGSSSAGVTGIYVTGAIIGNCVITGNHIDGGGASTFGIQLLCTTPFTYGARFVVTSNKIDTAGTPIKIDHVTDSTFIGNRFTGSVTAPVAETNGSNNIIEIDSGNGLSTAGKLHTGTRPTSYPEQFTVGGGNAAVWYNGSTLSSGYGFLGYSNGASGASAAVAIGGMYVLQAAAAAQSGRLEWYTANAGAPTSKMVLTKEGYLGIGATAAQTTTVGLTISTGVNNGIRLGNIGSAWYYDFYRETITGPLYFYGSQTGATGYYFTGVDGLRFFISTTGSVVVGSGAAALATNATDGFLYVPTCAGTPTGTPTAVTGSKPLVYDTTNNKLYVYNGAWKSVTLA